MHRRRQRDSPSCPICMTEDESLVHILTCPDSRSADLRATLLLELHEWLIAELTCPWIREFLFYGLRSWFDDPPEGHEPGLNWHAAFALSAQAQLSLGWYATLFGFYRNRTYSRTWPPTSCLLQQLLLHPLTVTPHQHHQQPEIVVPRHPNRSRIH